MLAMLKYSVTSGLTASTDHIMAFPSFSFDVKAKDREKDEANKREHNGHRKRRKHHDGRESRSKRRSESSAGSDNAVGSSSLFYIDTKGDQLNSRFESTYKYERPRISRPAEPARPAGLVPSSNTPSNEQVTDNEHSLNPNHALNCSITDNSDFIPLDENAPGSSRQSSPSIDRQMAKLLEERARVSRYLAENYHNVDAWFDLLDVEYRISKDSKSIDNYHGEIAPAIVEKALRYSPSDPRLQQASVQLRDRSGAEWREFVSSHPSSTISWSGWLNSYTSVLYDEPIDDLLDHLAMKGEILDYLRELSEKEDIGIAYIDIVARIAKLFRDAGYEERGFAIFQALVEFNFCCPNDDWGIDERRDAFKQYWELETGHFAEPGAVTWKNTSFDDPNEPFAPEKQPIEKGNLSINYRFPLRTVSEEALNDMEAVALYDDFAPLLVIILGQDHLERLLFAFLDYLGIQTIGGDVHDSWDDAAMELIRHAVKYLVTIPTSFAEWAMKYTRRRDEGFFRRVSQAILRKDEFRRNVRIYQMYLSLAQWESEEAVESIERELINLVPQNTLADCLVCWIRRMRDVLVRRQDGTPVKKIPFVEDEGFEAKFIMKVFHVTQLAQLVPSVNEHREKALIQGDRELLDCALFIVNYMQMEVPDDKTLLQMVKKYWGLDNSKGEKSVLGTRTYIPRGEFHEWILTIADILERHATKNDTVPTRSLRAHVDECTNTVDSFYIPEIHLLERLAHFQTRYKMYHHLPVSLDTQNALGRDGDKFRLVMLQYALANEESEQSKRYFFKRAAKPNNAGQACTSPRLWQEYVSFELDHNKEEKAVEVLLQGVSNCPWNKRLIALAIDKMGTGILGADTVQQIRLLAKKRHIRMNISQ
uniref:ARAD1A16500p n=1 Tax=Blastobotrys adeninivorans TaxID=409370 RepID=A0A060SYH5_BLAAD